MGGQAVEEDGGARCVRHQRGIDGETRERRSPGLPFGLLAHRGPDVRVDGLGAEGGLGGIVQKDDRPAGRRRALAGRSDDVGRGLVTRRRGDPQLEAAERGGLDQRMADVVAVADEGDLDTGEAAELLLEGQDVRERLAGMVLVRQRIDHRDRRRCGQLLDRRLREGADGDGIEIQRQRARGVADRLATTHLELIGPEHDRQHAEHPGRRLEADPCPGRWLVEDHPEPTAGQAVPERVRVPLEPPGQVQQRAQLPGIEFVKREEVARRRRGHRGSIPSALHALIARRSPAALRLVSVEGASVHRIVHPVRHRVPNGLYGPRVVSPPRSVTAPAASSRPRRGYRVPTGQPQNPRGPRRSRRGPGSERRRTGRAP